VDGAIEDWVVAHRAGWLTAALKIITWPGSNIVLVPLVAVVAVTLLLRWRRWSPGVFLALSLGGATALKWLTKALADRPRPPATLALVHATGSAFPSGHATQLASVFAGLAVLAVTHRAAHAEGHRAPIRAALWVAAVFLLLAVSVSRVYLGIHWATDVVAGSALGAGWAAALLLVMRLLRFDPAPAPEVRPPTRARGSISSP
jgi:membrane-associated phospholipid phosphatase